MTNLVDLTKRREGRPPGACPARLEIGAKLFMELLALGVVIVDLVVGAPWYLYAGLCALALVVAWLLQVYVWIGWADRVKHDGFGKLGGTGFTVAVGVLFLVVILGSFSAAVMKLVILQPFAK